MKRPGITLVIGAMIAASLVWTGSISVAADEPVPQLVLGFQPEVVSGTTIAISAYLVDPAGNPVVGEEITFSIAAAFLNVEGQMEIGSATTDAEGLALLPYAPRIEGDRVIRAQFGGNSVFKPARETDTLLVMPGPQLYKEFSPLRIPGANIWMAAGVLTVVWGVFLYICVLIGRIAFLGMNRATPLPETGNGASDV